MVFRKQRRKAVSPVVSAVLLIALAVSIGILVTNFVTSFVSTETGGSDITCALNTNYVIESAQFNKTGFYNKLLIKITNKNSEGLYGFGVIMDNGTKIVQFNSSNSLINQGGVSDSNKLEREESVFLTVDLTNTTLGYPVFGLSLTTSDESQLKVLNNACDAVSTSTTTIV